MISKNPSLLEQLEASINVDCDTMDHEFVQTLPITCHDMTSNQKFVHDALVDPRNKDIVQGVVKSMKGATWEEVYAACIAKFGKRMLPLISGRVLAQTSPSHAYERDYIVENARRYAKAWKAEGIESDRFCVKIAVTSAGVQAAKILKAEGIPTLGTALFSLPQALGASQSGMHAISMYFNEPLAHSDPSMWPDVPDPATQHPMAARHIHIRETYNKLAKEGKPQPQIKTASFVNCREVMAMVELGADHVTLGEPILADLAAYHELPAHRKGVYKSSFKTQIDEPHFIWESWNPPVEADAKTRMAEIAKSDPVGKIMAKDFKIASTDVDYLADGVLDKCNEDDEVTRLRLAEGLKRFSIMEEKSKQEIERLQKELA